MRVDADDRVGGGGTGWDTWNEVLHDGAILLAAQAVGGAQHALDITVQYSKDREQFDKPLGAFQALAHDMADAKHRGRRGHDSSPTRRPGPGRQRPPTMHRSSLRWPSSSPAGPTAT
ncbi:MAG: acyl-CoA dehydrogenase family protein [Acidimicrobiia bacterium]|nr:acyl-CoA dehydrogenase family protein [Acidimicrobiia bacterium]